MNEQSEGQWLSQREVDRLPEGTYYVTDERRTLWVHGKGIHRGMIQKAEFFVQRAVPDREARP